jgi:hypothetical protein
MDIQHAEFLYIDSVLDWITSFASVGKFMFG